MNWQSRLEIECPMWPKIWLENVTYLAYNNNAIARKHAKSAYDRAIVCNMLLLNAYNHFWSNTNMARKTSKSSTGSWGTTFVSWLPNSEHKDLVTNFVNSNPDIPVHLEDIIANGYKVSVSYDGENDTFIVALTNREAAEEFRNHCITFRHRQLDKALCLMIWFEIEYTEGDWGVIDASSRYDW